MFNINCSTLKKVAILFLSSFKWRIPVDTSCHV